MKKIILFVSWLISALANAQSPTFEWAKKFDGISGVVLAASVATDNAGNVFTTGRFNGTVDFDPGAGTFYLASADPDPDVFITKTDASGNFGWAKRIGGTSTDAGAGIATDGAGNSYTFGTFNSLVDFDPGSSTYNLSASDGQGAFICKLDPSGNFVWAKAMTGSSDTVIAGSIKIDGSGNIFTTGSFYGTVDFDPGAGASLLTAAGAADVFVLKLDASGNFVWTKSFGGIGQDEAKSITVDASGNVFATGSFSGTADFDPGAAMVNLTSAGGSDIFVSKLDASGNFVWAKALGSTSTDHGNSIVSDASGNVFTTGDFRGTTDFDPGAGTFNLTASSSDIFILKLNASGNFAWAKQMGDIVNEYGQSIAVDASGNIFTTGYFYGTVDFDPGAAIVNLTAAGNSDVFISKLDASGNFVWAKQLGGAQNDNGNSITADASGNIFTTGNFSRIADFDPGGGTYNLMLPGYVSGQFISKLNSSGNFMWAKSAGNGAAAIIYDIATDGSGNVFTTGFFYGTIDFDPGGGIYNLISAGGSPDIFVCKSDAFGNFAWAKQLGGTTGDDYGKTIAIDGSGNVYTSGYFSSTADFDPGAGTFNLTSAGLMDIFISKLDASGNFVWAKGLGGTGDDQAGSISIDASGNILTTGIFANTFDFDPGPGTYNLTSLGSWDVFVSKLDAAGNFVWGKQIGGTNFERGTSISTDASGSVFITGQFYGTADFDPGPGSYNLTVSGYYAGFVSKLDAAGNFVWAKAINGSNVVYPNSIALDASGNILTTGYFPDTVDFDPGPGIYNLVSAGKFDIFVSKLDGAGNFVWAKRIGGQGYDEGNAVATDGTGNVYITGYYTGSALQNIYIGKIDASGTSVWEKILLGPEVGNGYSINIDPLNNIYTAGTFAGTVDFDPDAAVYNLTSLGNPGAFIHKMSQCTPPSAMITPSGPTTFCSGGNVVLNAPGAANRSYQWKKGTNLISGATLSAYTATTGGNYKVIVTNTTTGCSKTTGSPTVITVNPKPSATITPQGPTTFCAGGSVVLKANSGTGLTYKWKKGTNFIAGATLVNYTATTAGTYRVEVTNSNGCTKLSGGVTVTVPCKLDGSESKRAFDINVFPNPNSGEFTVEFSKKLTSPVQIELTDEMGKVVKTFETIDETIVIKESKLAKGIYCLSVRNNDEVVIKKIGIAQ